MTQPLIYKATASEGYEFCVSENTREAIAADMEMDGRPLLGNWKPYRVRIVRREGRKQLLASDAPGSIEPIFTNRAIQRLRPLLGCGELLPLVCEEAELYIFNVTRVIDALDMEASSYETYNDGSIMTIMHDGYVFRPDVVAGVDIFRSTGFRLSPVFFGQRFVDLWRSQGLRGLDFLRVGRA